jgi:rhomboid protease GluP
MGSSSSMPEPEFLPPGSGTTTQPPVRRPRPSWAVAPATYILIAINCLVFLWMVAHHVSAFTPTNDQIMHYGADSAGAVLIQGEWVRIVTAMFVHYGLIHLATNMWCLWNLGLLAEPLLGSAGMVAAYILTGAAGNLLATFYNWKHFYPDWVTYQDLSVFPPGVGASGAVFGIAGVLIILLKSKRLPVPPEELRSLRKSVIYFAGINLAIGFSINFGSRFIGSGLLVDNMAHLGGFGSGLLMAMPLVPRLGSPKETFVTRRYLSIGMMVAILVLFGFFLAQLPDPH